MTVRHEVATDTKIAKTYATHFKKAERARRVANVTWMDADDKFRARVEAEETKAAYLKAEKDFNGWSRFFLVTNNNGHIHRWMNCSTCTFRTEFAWLPELSGLTDADAVEAHGSLLCTVCFPDAPVEFTAGVSKAKETAKALRALMKAPEAKKVAAARSKLSSARMNVTSLHSRLGNAHDAIDKYSDAPTFTAEDLAEFRAKIEDLEAKIVANLPKIAKLEVKLAEAEAVLTAALVG